MKAILELDDGLNNNFNKNVSEKENLQDNFSNMNNSFGDLSISDIGNKEMCTIPLSQRTNNKITENDELNNNYIINKIGGRASIGSLREDYNGIFFSKKKVKITKEDLNNIPIPLFSCIFCSNEYISFNHYISEILSNKYKVLTSIYDIQELTKILSNKFLIDKGDKNDKLENLIIQNTEYLNRYYDSNSEEFKKIVKLKGDDSCLFEMYQKKFVEYSNTKLNNFKLKKNKKIFFKVPSITKKINNYYSFNNNLNINSYINNSIDGIFNFNNKKNLQNNNINQTMSNLSVSNFNSVSLINYLDNNIPKEKENKFKLDDIIEQIEKNSNIESFQFDMSRNIKKEDIEWDTEYYNIWNPKIEPVFMNYMPVTTKTICNNINKTFIKMQKKNNKYYKIFKENNSNKVQSKGKENVKSNKSYQKNNNNSKNKTKEKYQERNKLFIRNKITHLITHSSKNNKRNILVNLHNNNTPKIKDHNNKNKINTFTKKDNSQKYLNKLSTNISLNLKKNLNMNPINLFNSTNKIIKLRNYQFMKNQIPLNISIVNKSTNMKKAKSKINFSINNSGKIKNDKNEKTNRNKKKENKILSENSSVSNKKVITKNKGEIKNALQKFKKMNGVNKNKKYLTNKISRNNTYQNLNNIKEKSVVINISKNCYCETKAGLSNEKNKFKSKKIVNSKNKIKFNLNIKENNNWNNNNIQIKNRSGKNKPRVNKYNYTHSNKNLYDIIILDKKSVEAKIRIFSKKKLYLLEKSNN